MSDVICLFPKGHFLSHEFSSSSRPSEAHTVHVPPPDRVCNIALELWLIRLHQIRSSYANAACGHYMRRGKIVAREVGSQHNSTRCYCGAAHPCSMGRPGSAPAVARSEMRSGRPPCGARAQGAGRRDGRRRGGGAVAAALWRRRCGGGGAGDAELAHQK